MAIVKMDHVRLIAMTEDREEILRRLQRLGCVEIDQAVLPADQPQSGQAPPAETDSLSLLREQLSRPDTQRLSAAREEQNQADHALYVLKKYAPAKEKFLVPKPSLTRRTCLTRPQQTGPGKVPRRSTGPSAG